MPYNPRLYASAEEFYGEDLARRDIDIDQGVMWTDPPLPGMTGHHPGWPQWRVSWIPATGELYAICFTADGAGACPVRVYGRFADEAAMRRALHGWWDECPKPGSLAWLEDIFRRAANEPELGGGSHE
jgi:hypothetical protein